MREWWRNTALYLQYETVGWWGVLDEVCHTLHVPDFIQRRVCDKVDAVLVGDAHPTPFDDDES